MKVFIFLLTLALGFIIADSTAHGQNRQLSGGLGLSDAEWKELFGNPTPFARDAWSYRSGRYYTRSWYRKDAPAGRDYPGYIADNYYVKYIEVIWGHNSPASSAQARAEINARLPIDAKVISKYRRRGAKAAGYYSSEYLAARLFPGMAGDNYCVTPWGYGVGKFRVEYYFAKGRVWRAVIDIGEPHEVPLDVCRGN
jgi:hypothetical protein